MDIAVLELIHQFRNVSWYKVLSRAAIVFFANHGQSQKYCLPYLSMISLFS